MNFVMMFPQAHPVLEPDFSTVYFINEVYLYLFFFLKVRGVEAAGAAARETGPRCAGGHPKGQGGDGPTPQHDGRGEVRNMVFRMSVTPTLCTLIEHDFLVIICIY